MPPRFVWLKRFAVLGVGIAVAVGLLRVCWGWAAYYRLNTQLAAYRAAGEPVFVEEFNSALDAVPEERNAASRLKKAMGILAGSADSGIDVYEFLRDPTTFDRKSGDAAEFMQKNAAVFALVREARGLPEVAWETRIGGEGSQGGRWGEYHRLALLSGFALAYHLRTGDHESAVGVLRDFLAVSHAIESEPLLSSNLMAWAAYDWTFAYIEEHVHWIRILGEAPAPSDVPRPALRAEVELLLRDLLLESPMRDNLVRSHYGSRAETIHLLETRGAVDSWAGSGTMPKISVPWKTVVDFMLHPALVLDTDRDAGYYTFAARGWKQATLAEAAKRQVSKDAPAHLLHRLTRPITHTPWGSSASTFEKVEGIFFRTLARRRMAALAVAIRLYVEDHGERPPELTLLVPRYLPELPRDPFSPAERSFVYLPEADRPCLYSVGLDGVDNQGQVVIPTDGPFDGEGSDIPLYLEGEKDGDGIEPESGAETHDDHENVEDQERE